MTRRHFAFVALLSAPIFTVASLANSPAPVPRDPWIGMWDLIRGQYQHHAAHVAYVMAIAGSGLQLAPLAETTEFHGRPGHALTFTRTAKVVHPY